MLAIGLLVGITSAIVINYLADTLPATRKLTAPEWWPLSAKSVTKYLSRFRTWLTTVLSIVISVVVFTLPTKEMSVYVLVFMLAYFGLVAVIDIEHRVVMHPVSIAGFLALGAIGVTRHGAVDTLLGGLAGFGAMLAVYLLGEWLGKLMARLRKEPWEETALGFGDVNLAGVIGLLMGWPGVVAALFVGMLAAALYSAGYLIVTMLQRKYQPFASIPYAPFLCLGAVIVIALSIYRT